MLLNYVRTHKAIAVVLAMVIAIAVVVCCWLPSYLEELEWERTLENAWWRPPPGFRTGGVIYACNWRKTVEVTEDEVQILGYVEDYLKTKEDEYADGIATMSSAVGEPYGEYQGMMLLRFDGGWHECIPTPGS